MEAQQVLKLISEGTGASCLDRSEESNAMDKKSVREIFLSHSSAR